MDKDIFAEQSYGKVALKKFGDISENFRLYCAGWLGDYKTTDTMEVKGAEFRKALSGKNKGKLTILVKNTERVAYVTMSEMDEYERSSEE